MFPPAILIVQCGIKEHGGIITASVQTLMDCIKEEGTHRVLFGVHLEGWITH